VSDARELLELATTYSGFILLILTVVFAWHLIKRKDFELHEARAEMREQVEQARAELKERTDQLIDIGQTNRRSLDENTTTSTALMQVVENLTAKHRE